MAKMPMDISDEKSVTVTPKSPNTCTSNTLVQVGSLVSGLIRFSATASANTQTQIATLDKKPTEQVQFIAMNTGNNAIGKFILETTGVLYIVFPSALSSSGIAMSLNYKTND